MNPFGFEICIGEKPLEFRSWDTKFRGLVLIHVSSSKQFEKEFELFPEVTPEEIELMRGAIIGFANLTDSFWRDEDNSYCHRMENPCLFRETFKTPGALNYWRPGGKYREQQLEAFQRAWNSILDEDYEPAREDAIAKSQMDYGLSTQAD